MCPLVHALPFKKKGNTEATGAGREMGMGEEPSWLSQEVSQQEVPEVLRMEPTSPGLVSAHMSSNCSMVIGATTPITQTAGEIPWTEHSILIWQSSRATQQVPAWSGTVTYQLADMESPLDIQNIHFIGYLMNSTLG